MASLLGFAKRVHTAFNSPEAKLVADSTPVQFGILGAANIAPHALILAARSHPEAVVHAVAARDKKRADAFAKKYHIPTAYGGPTGYQELIDDPEVHVVYNPLPNALHYEWTMKALAAGKHVLLEKPSADTSDETRQMFQLAEKKGVVLLEAFHYRFHPAIQRVKAIIDSRELGAIKQIHAALAIPKGGIGTGDIRYNYALGGGALMDMGCYTISCIRYLSSSNPISVVSASHDVHMPSGSPADFKPNLDRGTAATLALPNDVTASLKCDFGMPAKFGIMPRWPDVRAVVQCDEGEVEIVNFVLPTVWHTIKVTKKDAKGGKKTRVEKVYTFADAKMDGKGEAWWTTYRYQLEAFIDRLKGRTPQTWVDKEDSIANMEVIEQIYAKTGLGSRPKSTFVPPQEA